VSSINCDRPLRSAIRAAETVMSTGGQLTDSPRPCAPAGHRSTGTCCREAEQAMGRSVLSRRMSTEAYRLEETDCQDAYCNKTLRYREEHSASLVLSWCTF